MHIYARQGDLVIEKLPKLEGSLELHPVRDLVIAGGVDGATHTHRLRGAGLAHVETSGAVHLHLVEPCELLHERAGGHKPVELPAGFYGIHPLRERGDANDRNVED